MNIVKIYALSLIKGIGNTTILSILKNGHTVEDFIRMPKEIKIKSIRGKDKDASLDELNNKFDTYVDLARLKLDQFREQGIFAISYFDRQYPKYLRLISKPPLFLFVKGNIEILNNHKSVAIIGTRKSSVTGEEIARRVSRYLSENCFVIVSGLAAGIDKYAHIGSLDVSNGRTIGVLVDVNKVTPKENKEIANQILANGGALISENPPGSYISRGSFVERDRIISGLSAGVFPIEAALESGTMHTVNFGIEQQRLIFAPDLSGLKGYEHYFENNKGILHLINSNKAITFTHEKYPELCMRLIDKINDLNKMVDFYNNNDIYSNN